MSGSHVRGRTVVRLRSTPGLAALAVVAAFALSGCAATSTTPPPEAGNGSSIDSSASSAGTGEPALLSGDTATWTLVDPGSITSESTTLDVEVTRLDCAGGVTGELLDPVVTYASDAVTIRIDAVLRGEEAADCQGNDAVPVTVELTEPLGERALVDGGCLRSDAQGTAPCVTGERRSTP